MTYRALDEISLLDYIGIRPKIKECFTDLSTLSVREVGDGNLNLVFIVQNDRQPDEAVIIKQALPYLRVAGDSWPLTRERMRFETQALLLYNDLTPGLAPAVYDNDEALSLVAMEYLGAHEVMRRPLVMRQQFPQFADHISTFLAQILFKTSDLYLTGPAKKALQATYINPHLCKIQEDFVFTNPYKESPENNWNPEIGTEVRAVRENTQLKLAIAELKEKYMTRGQALIHSDLHTGSIMVNDHDTRVIDPEFSFFGPIGYDVGALLSNLMMNFGSHFVHTQNTHDRETYQNYLLTLIHDIWEQFATKFERLWIDHNQGELVPDPYWDFPGGGVAFTEYRSRYMRQLLQDTAGLGACESLRRMMGIVNVWDISSIEDHKQRAIAERYIMRVSSRWILERHNFKNVNNLTDIMKQEAQSISPA